MAIKKEILSLKIDEVKINEKNPRRHNKLNVNMIKKSIDKVGFIDNIIVDEDNIILAGHGRLLALKELGKKDIDVTRVSGLTEAQKKQYLVYSNRTTETSEWDSEILVDITDELLKTDKDFLVGDFEMEELINIYKIEEINEVGVPVDVAKDEHIHVVGIAYTKETQEVTDFINSIKQLKEQNADVEIFSGKEITNPKGKL